MTGSRERGRPRRLSAEEHSLWKTITRAVKPLRVAPPAEGPEEKAAEGGPQPPRKAAPSSVDPSHSPVRKPASPPSPPLAPLERRLRQRLARGSETIDRRLDLHGLTQREAHAALAHFLRAAQAQGVRIVLVVTGKGARAARDDPFAERGVLRRLVPQWLAAAEFRSLVVGFEAAHLGHGGEGALYVRLRRRRGA